MITFGTHPPGSFWDENEIVHDYEDRTDRDESSGFRETQRDSELEDKNTTFAQFRSKFNPKGMKFINLYNPNLDKNDNTATNWKFVAPPRDLNERYGIFPEHAIDGVNVSKDVDRHCNLHGKKVLEDKLSRSEVRQSRVKWDMVVTFAGGNRTAPHLNVDGLYDRISRKYCS